MTTRQVNNLVNIMASMDKNNKTKSAKTVTKTLNRKPCTKTGKLVAAAIAVETRYIPQVERKASGWLSSIAGWAANKAVTLHTDAKVRKGLYTR